MSYLQEYEGVVDMLRQVGIVFVFSFSLMNNKIEDHILHF